MNRTAQTSPFYAGWVAQARDSFDAGVHAVMSRDMSALADVMASSALRMHGCAMAARPPVMYWKADSLAVVARVDALRSAGVACGWTMDAGPNVKVLVEAPDADAVEAALSAVPGVQRVIRCRPGTGARAEVMG